MDPSEEDNVEYTDDDSYVFVDSEGYSSAKSDEGSGSGFLSSDTDTDSESWASIVSLDIPDALGMDKTCHFETAAYVKSDYDQYVFEFPAYFKWKEDMGIADIVKEHALPFLPAKSLVRFRAVSKEWDKWILNPFLVHQQTYFFSKMSGFFHQDGWRGPSFLSLNESSPSAASVSYYGVPTPPLAFLPEPVDIRSSCNGLLLCQGRTGENAYYVCNPVNREWEQLPQPQCYHGFDPAIVIAFEPNVLNMAADYDVVCAISLIDNPVVCFEIYSSETRSWRLSHTDCIAQDFNPDGNCFYAKGTAYWWTSSDEVVAFDLKSEFCGLFPLPCENRRSGGALTLLQGEVCYVQAYAPPQTENATSYLIEIYGGVDMSLKQRISVDHHYYWGNEIIECRILPCIDDEVVMIVVGGDLHSYHVRNRKGDVVSRRLGGDGNGSSTARFFPYVNSLVHVTRQ